MSQKNKIKLLPVSKPKKKKKKKKKEWVKKNNGGQEIHRSAIKKGKL